MLTDIAERIHRRSFAERYLGVAVIVWGFYGTLSAVLLHTGLRTFVAGGIAYSLALVLHFSLQRLVVFRQTDHVFDHVLGAQVWRYLFTALAQYLFTIAATADIVRWTHVHRAVAYIGCAAFAAVLNFLGLRLFVFRYSARGGDASADDDTPAAAHPGPNG